MNEKMITLLIKDLGRIQGFAYWEIGETQKIVYFSRGCRYRVRCKLKDDSNFTICYNRFLEN